MFYSCPSPSVNFFTFLTSPSTMFFLSKVSFGFGTLSPIVASSTSSTFPFTIFFSLTIKPLSNNFLISARKFASSFATFSTVVFTRFSSSAFGVCSFSRAASYCSKAVLRRWSITKRFLIKS